MNNPFLIILDWMTGSGKTTVSKSLSKQIPRLATVWMDKIKRFISDFERWERDNTIARDIVFVMIKRYLDHNISVLIDQPFKTEEEIKEYESLIHKYWGQIYKFQLFTDPDIAFKRVINRQKDREIKVPKNRIKRNIWLFKNKENNWFLAIDTSNISSEEVTKIIIDKIGRWVIQASK